MINLNGHMYCSFANDMTCSRFHILSIGATFHSRALSEETAFSSQWQRGWARNFLCWCELLSSWTLRIMDWRNWLLACLLQNCPCANLHRSLSVDCHTGLFQWAFHHVYISTRHFVLKVCACLRKQLVLNLLTFFDNACKLGKELSCIASLT